MPNGFNARHSPDGANEQQPEGARRQYLENVQARQKHVGDWLRNPRYRDFTSNREQMSDLYHRFQTGANDAARAQYNDATDRWQHEHISRHFSDNTMSPVWGPRREFQGSRNYNNYIDRLNYGPGDRGSYGRNGWIRSTPTQQDIGMYYQQMNAQQRYQNQAPYNYRNNSQYGPGVPVQQEVQELLQNLQNMPEYRAFQAQQGFRNNNNGLRGNPVPVNQQIQNLSRQLQNTRNPQQRQQIMKRLTSLANSAGLEPGIRVAGARSDSPGTNDSEPNLVRTDVRTADALSGTRPFESALSRGGFLLNLHSLADFCQRKDADLNRGDQAVIKQVQERIEALSAGVRTSVPPEMLGQPQFASYLNRELARVLPIIRYREVVNLHPDISEVMANHPAIRAAQNQQVYNLYRLEFDVAQGNIALSLTNSFNVN